MTSNFIPISVSFARTSSFVSGIAFPPACYAKLFSIIAVFFYFSLDIHDSLVKNIIKNFARGVLFFELERPFPGNDGRSRGTGAARVDRRPRRQRRGLGRRRAPSAEHPAAEGEEDMVRARRTLHPLHDDSSVVRELYDGPLLVRGQRLRRGLLAAHRRAVGAFRRCARPGLRGLRGELARRVEARLGVSRRRGGGPAVP